MSALFAALPGRWALLDADTVWWQSTHGGRTELLEIREHATLAACEAFRTRDEHVAAVAPGLGLTGSRAARLFDALVERGLIVAATVPPAAGGGPAVVDAVVRADERGWLAPVGADLRIAFAPGALPGALSPATLPDPAALLGLTWPGLAAKLGVAGETLAGRPHGALAHWREPVVVRAVVGGASRTSAADARPAPLLALDASALVPRALLDGDADTAWLVTAIDAVHGRGSVLALPFFRSSGAAATLPLGTRALFEALALAASRFASRDAATRLRALAAVAADLADADDEALGRTLRRAALALLGRDLAEAPRDTVLRDRIVALDDAALDIAGTRALAARIAANCEALPHRRGGAVA